MDSQIAAASSAEVDYAIQEWESPAIVAMAEEERAPSPPIAEQEKTGGKEEEEAHH